MCPSPQKFEHEKSASPLDTGFALLENEQENSHLYNSLKRVCFLGAVIHILFIFFFLSIGSIYLSVLNVLSVLTWLVAMYENQRGRYVLATLIGSVEVIVHAFVATLFLGLDMGFQYFLWPVAALIIVSNLFPPLKSRIIGFTIILTFAALNILAADITYQYAFPTLTPFVLFANISWAALAFVIVLMSAQTNSSQSERKLYELTNQDPLTGAVNRQFVYEWMKQTYSERRNLKSLDYTLVLTDIDNFKNINELIGHQAADSVITSVADYLHSAVRESDIVARWGGEQFLIILMNIEPDDAQILIEKIRKNVRYQIKADGLNDYITTLSFGVAKAKESEQFEETIKRADISMYKAKKLGKDRTIIAD
ncbi:MAG: diguanylate cyclase (GGDEF)-like protein [Glaciecola sp.]